MRMSPRPKITDVRREEIVRAALEVISQRGFHDTRVADIAERAGTSAPAVLYHFDSKGEILDAVVSLAEDRFYDGVEATLAEDVGPAARLVRFLENRAYDARESVAKLSRKQSQHERRQGRQDREVVQRLR